MIQNLQQNDLKELVKRFKEVYKAMNGEEFPQDPKNN